MSQNPFELEEPKVERHVLVKVFKELRHLCFVWSTDEQHTDRLPANVLAGDWMPQNAVLGKCIVLGFGKNYKSTILLVKL